jgi:hypothetical protein
MWKWLRRWAVLMTLLVVAVAVAVGLVFLPSNRVTRENCERIKEGMTEAEVRDILGKPWENSLLDPDEPEPETFWSASGTIKRSRLDVLAKRWDGNSLVVFVFFDADGRVRYPGVAIGVLDPDRSRSSLPSRVWRRLRARLGW